MNPFIKESFTIQIFDRKYEKYEIISLDTSQSKVEIIDPIVHKLFHKDVFTFEDRDQENRKEPMIIKSTIREKPFFAGILVLTGNKTYGRKNTSISMKKHEKLLYKCIPNDPFLPSFLIPYEMKTMGFSKLFHNLYVIFKYDHWEDKHPHGILLQTIGQVNELANFYEYQLYCKNLHISINHFEKDTSKAIKKITDENKELFDLIQEKYPNSLEDRTTNTTVFTIDPKGSIDFDDAFSIQKISNEPTTFRLSIYISNVPVLLDTLQLWKSFGERISTIYLPDKKRSMIPAILGDHLCSLREKTVRAAFTMDILIDFVEQTQEINRPYFLQVKEITFKNTLIKVHKNYVYEEPSLLNNLNYQLLFDITKEVYQQRQPKYLSQINDSHEVVEYLMMWMNHECSKQFLPFKNGIFRSTISSKVSPIVKENIPAIPNELFVGKYVDQSNTEQLRHNALGLDTYIHITSPIRRLVDLLNMIKLQENLGIITLSKNASVFYKDWLNKLEEINRDMKNIRRVQNQCTLLELCTNHPTSLEKKWEGYVFHREEREKEKDSGMGLYFYEVYLTDLKIVSKIVTSRVFEEYTKCLFQIYVFNDEESFKKKIRIQILDT
jgi:exoribonuclease R